MIEQMITLFGYPVLNDPEIQYLHPTHLQKGVCIERGYVLGAIPQSDYLCLSSTLLPRRGSTTLSRRGRSG